MLSVASYANVPRPLYSSFKEDGGEEFTLKPIMKGLFMFSLEEFQRMRMGT